LPYIQKAVSVSKLSQINSIHTRTNYKMEIYFLFTLAFTPPFSQWSLYIRSPHQFLYSLSPLCHKTHMPCPLYPSCLDQPNTISNQYRSQISSLCKSTSHFSPRKSHQFPQQSAMKFLYPIFIRLKTEEIADTNQLEKISFPYIPNYKFLSSNWKKKIAL